LKRDSVTVVSAKGEEVPAGGERETAPFSVSGAEPTGQGRTIREGEVLGGKYQVDRVLRTGGMGVVLVATHVQLKEKVALKVLLGQAAGESSAVARFLREARAATSVKSEHVVRILDFGTLDGGEPYLVMELLQGRDLRDVLEQNGPLPVETAVRYMLQVCRGLSAVHAQRIIHRDLKPANLFLTETSDGTPLVKLLDFGIAKALEPERLLLDEATETLTHASQLLGSPVYMSPEQIRCSTKVDERSDVWSLGVILHELVTGEPPFQASTVSGLLATIAADAPQPLREAQPNAPAALEDVISGCLEKDVDKRIASVDELAARLRRVTSSGAPRSKTWLYVVAAAVLAAAVTALLLVRSRPAPVVEAAPQPTMAAVQETREPSPPPPSAMTAPPGATAVAASAAPSARPHPREPARPPHVGRPPAAQPSSPVAPSQDFESSATDRRK
jgi:serine/threonine-protein kinase